ncbi:hypothetical protein K2X05_06860 [bacterium]|nr:hypothetical protein [bacterium]
MKNLAFISMMIMSFVSSNVFADMGRMEAQKPIKEASASTKQVFQKKNLKNHNKNEHPVKKTISKDSKKQ